MKKLTQGEIKEQLLNILIHFDEFCNKHNITYYLGGGTLLGAVRHKGFIPWDDDIDVFLPRKDYERFLEIFPSNSSYADLGLEAHDYKTSDDHLLPFAKLYNKRYRVEEVFDNKYRKKYRNNKLSFLFIDLFPLDGVPAKPLLLKLYFLHLSLYKYLVMATTRNLKCNYSGRFLVTRLLKCIVSTPIILISRFIPLKKVLKKIDQKSKTYSYEDARIIANTVGRYGITEACNKDIFSSSIQMGFEGHLFPVPLLYDKYLTHIYGDYLVLPEKNKQMTHFEGEVYEVNSYD
ncbi:MAG: LicD family protein [Sphaerochaetaceae bacterium]